MKARWKTLLVGALVPALVTGGIAVADRDGDHRSDHHRGARHAWHGHHRGGPPGLGLLRNLTYGDLHVRENGKEKVVRVDKGTLVSASAQSIEMKRNDGATVTVAVDSKTQVLAGFGFRGRVSDLKPGRPVIAVHEGDHPATLVASPPRRRHRRGGFRMPPPPGPPGGFHGPGEIR